MGLAQRRTPVAYATAEKTSDLPRETSGVRASSRVNGQIGYPLSPLNAPHLPPIEPILETAFSLPHAVPPVAGARQDIADAVVRVPSYNGKHDLLECEIDGYMADVHYDLERNAFIQSMHLNDIDPPYYVPSQSGERSLVKLEDPERPVTDEQRMETLRALGVDVILPMSLAELRPPSAKPIAQKISCIWVGNKVISPQLLENVGRNDALLRNSITRIVCFSPRLRQVSMLATSNCWPRMLQPSKSSRSNLNHCTRSFSEAPITPSTKQP